MQRAKRFVVVGTGGRSTMYLDALAGDFRDRSMLAGMCDISPARMRWHRRRLQRDFGQPEIPAAAPDDFEHLLRSVDADGVVVCSVDSTHAEYIVRAMEQGCDVICEKPLVTDEDQARQVLRTIERTGRSLRVTFNMRYAPVFARIKEVLSENPVGRPLAVDFRWLLDTHHGADYFRRWHREKDCSGGLQIHKSSHHFDLLNWYLEDLPQQVFAMGDIKFYGRANAAARGEDRPYERYTGEAGAAEDPFALFLDRNEKLRGLYLEAEKDSGYLRDRNVFGDNITSEDTLAILVRYRGGPIMNYSLVAYSPWEGLQLAITCDRGRVEFTQRYRSHIIAGQGEKELAAEQGGELPRLVLHPMFGAPREVELPLADGAHGGGDRRLMEDLFGGKRNADPLGRQAGYGAGAAAALIGMAANRSMESGGQIDCEQLLPGLERLVHKNK